MSTFAPPADVRWFTDTRVRILVAEDTYSLVESEAPYGCMPPLHVHHGHDEIFYVLDGRISLHRPGRSIELGAGEAAFAERGVPHTYRVESEDGARVVVATTSGEFAAFVAETSIVAEDEDYAPDGVLPPPEVLAATGLRYGIEVLGPPGAMPV